MTVCGLITRINDSLRVGFLTRRGKIKYISVFLVCFVKYLYLCHMKNKIIISDKEQLRYISEAFNKDYDRLEDRELDLDCQILPTPKLIAQPRCITYLRVRASRSHRRILEETLKCLQPYMMDRAIDIVLLREKFNVVVDIDTNLIPHIAGCLDRIETFFRNLERLRFSFSWDQPEVLDEDGVVYPAVQYNYSGIIFIGHIRRKGSSVYGVHINPMAIPYLIFIGKEMGSTKSEPKVVEKLSTVYCLNFYYYLCDWNVRGGLYSVSLSDLKEMLEVPDSYTFSVLKKRVFDPVLSVLEEEEAEISFEYNLVYSSSNVTKKKVEGLEFVVFRTKEDISRDVMRRALTACLVGIADRERLGIVETIVEDIVDSGKGSRLLEKFRYYQNKLAKGEMRETEYKNTMLKILRESYDLDLRSYRHVKNSERAEAVTLARVSSFPMKGKI